MTRTQIIPTSDLRPTLKPRFLPSLEYVFDKSKDEIVYQNLKKIMYGFDTDGDISRLTFWFGEGMYSPEEHTYKGGLPEKSVELPFG